MSLTKKFSKSKKLKICNKVIEHWMENLFLAYAGDLKISDILSGKCEFCHHFKNSCCSLCPLFESGNDCNKNGVWDDIFLILDNEPENPDLIKAVEKMLRLLEKVCDNWVTGLGDFKGNHEKANL